MVQKAFQVIDKDGSGILDIDDIKDSYNASKHPDVLAGKRTEDDILVEFLQTFEAHHNLKEGGQSDGRVTLEEFTEYYKNISSSIDNDDYFALMMNNSWNIKGDASPYQKYEKGWANEDAKPKQSAELRHKAQVVQRSGAMSSDNPLSTTNKFYKNTTSASRTNATSGAMFSGGPTNQQSIQA